MSGKPDCKNHPETVEKYDGTLKELAEDIGDLRYDKLSKLLSYLSLKLATDSHKDSVEGRDQLSNNLYYASRQVHRVILFINKAWKNCKQYMG